MHLLIAAATRFEIAPLLSHLQTHFAEFEPDRFQKGELQISVAITGVGLPLMGYAMGKLLNGWSYDLAVNAGVAGAFNRELALGTVFLVERQQFGDLGAEDADGHFLSIHDMGLIDPNQTPFQNGWLVNEAAHQSEFLPRVSSISVNKVHGYPPHIEQVKKRSAADIESMEGAAFFYACLLEEQPFLEIRAISNYVEARNRSAWKLDLAIERLNEVLVEMSGSFLR